MAGGFNPDWIPAGLAAVGAALAVSRWVSRSQWKRSQRSQIVDELTEAVWGHPARVDQRGIIYEPSEPGLEQRTGALETAHARHIEHPPGTDGLARGAP